VPEIAEREPKVTSAGLVHVGASFRGCLLCIMVLSLSSLPGGKLALWAVPRVRKWCSLSRLETRTKESDTDASIVVANHSAQ
jgi:hypothetical protein